MTRDKARQARDLLRPIIERCRETARLVCERLYENGNYRNDLCSAEKEALLRLLSNARGDLLPLARADRSYNNAIISYRPDARFDENNWEAVERQDHKREDAERGLRFLRGDA